MDPSPINKRWANTNQHCILTYDLECESTFGNPILCMFNVWFDGDFVKLKNDYLDIYYNDNGVACVAGYKGFQCIEKFRNFILNFKFPTKRVYIMSYNGSNFDDLYLFNAWKVKPYVLASTVQLKQVSFQTPSHYFISRDLRAYLTDGSLRDLSALIHLPKLDNDVTDIRHENIESYIPYCARDVNITIMSYLNLLIPLMEPYVGKCLSSAFDVFEFMSSASLDYYATVNSFENAYLIQGSAYEYGRRAYYGAKIDSCMYGLQKDVKNVCFDIRSMYPSAATNPLPSGKWIYKVKAPEIDITKDVHRNPPFIALVHLFKARIPYCNLDSQFGTVPFKTETGKTLYLSHGDIESVYTSYDIYAAMADGWQVLNMKYFIIWETWDSEFKELYDELFAVKEQYEKDSIMFKYAKKRMNGGVGSMCQKASWPFTNVNKPAHLGWFILSATRFFQVQMKKMCTRCEIPRVLYSDTDSIFFNALYINATN